MEGGVPPSMFVFPP